MNVSNRNWGGQKNGNNHQSERRKNSASGKFSCASTFTKNSRRSPPIFSQVPLFASQEKTVIIEVMVKSLVRAYLINLFALWVTSRIIGGFHLSEGLKSLLLVSGGFTLLYLILRPILHLFF